MKVPKLISPPFPAKISPASSGNKSFLPGLGLKAMAFTLGHLDSPPGAEALSRFQRPISWPCHPKAGSGNPVPLFIENHFINGRGMTDANVPEPYMAVPTNADQAIFKVWMDGNSLHRFLVARQGKERFIREDVP